MGRKKQTILDNLGKNIWNFPLKSFVLFFLSLNITLFLIHRIIMFHTFYKQNEQIMRDDLFVVENICKNDTLKANLGADYISLCHAAEINSEGWVFLRAAQETIRNTYFCGDIACLELFEQIMEIVTRSIVWAVCAVLVLIIFLLFLFVYCIGTCGFGRNWRKQKLNYIDIEYQNQPHHQEPLKILYHDDDYKNYKKKI